jgi:hypothetical protein
MQNNNPNFPPPREDDDNDDGNEDESNGASSLVEEALFPRVDVVIGGIPFRAIPPPLDNLMQESDGASSFILQRRQLSYLCRIMRSWQRSVLVAVEVFPSFADVGNSAVPQHPGVEIRFDHHGLTWRSSFFLSYLNGQRTLVVRIANDGYLYMDDKHHGMVQLKDGAGLPVPNPRNDNHPIGWVVPRTEWRDAVLAELVDFVDFAKSWFGGVEFETMVLYNAEARRLDVCFRSKQPEANGRKVALEFTFERDWPVASEGDWYW